LGFGGYLAMNAAFQCNDRQFKARSEVIVELFALPTVVAGGGHLLYTALSLEAAKFGYARVSSRSVGQSLSVNPKMLGVLDSIPELVKAGSDRMSFVFLWPTGHFDQTLVTVMCHGCADAYNGDSLEAASNTVHLSCDRSCPETLNPAARNFVGLPGRIIVRVFHPVCAGGDHPAH
jgi:hypothetical protein